MFFRMVYKSGQIFLPFCHNSLVWRTDRQTDRRTDRILITIPPLHYMQRGKNESWEQKQSRSVRWTWVTERNCTATTSCVWRITIDIIKTKSRVVSASCDICCHNSQKLWRRTKKNLSERNLVNPYSPREQQKRFHSDGHHSRAKWGWCEVCEVYNRPTAIHRTGVWSDWDN